MTPAPEDSLRPNWSPQSHSRIASPPKNAVPELLARGLWPLRVWLIAIMVLIVPRPALAETVTLEGVCFTPGEDCTGLIVQTIKDARRTIQVQAYSFTSTPIAQALADAKRHGIDVRVILDKSQRTERYSGADYLANAGVLVWIDAEHAIAHNKVMIIDQSTVITGSFNFTKAAQEKNAENVLITSSAKLAAYYAANWRRHAEHSTRYTGRNGP